MPPDTFGHLGEVGRAAQSLTARFGPAGRVVALNEGDLDTAALLRAKLGCPGLTPDELARFRDKLTMAQAVAAAGIRIPAFADAPDPQAVSRFAGPTAGRWWSSHAGARPAGA